jgi:hypothetical protein
MKNHSNFSADHGGRAKVPTGKDYERARYLGGDLGAPKIAWAE